MTLESELKAQAAAMGFALSGIAPASEADDFRHFQDWLACGFAGDMEYLGRHETARRHPAGILPDVRSVVMFALEYGDRGAANRRDDAPDSKPDSGRIARYAVGPDYHLVMRDKLKQLLGWLQNRKPLVRGRAVVDTAPLLERDFARRAGLGWIGKNTMLINKHRGSYLFLGALLLDIELQADPPHAGFHCGTCTACLDACPTDAFPAPGVLDARKCISYLTIELRGRMPDALRPGVGDWLFGCDVCQEVCPWNRKDRSLPESVDATEILKLSDDAFRARFGGTAIERTRRRGLVRNAAIVLGNTGDNAAVPALQAALDDPDEIVRDAAAWAIGRIEERLRAQTTDG